jgi:hypothetical protein
MTFGCLIKKLLLGLTDLLEELPKEKGSVRKAKRRVEYSQKIGCKGAGVHNTEYIDGRSKGSIKKIV